MKNDLLYCDQYIQNFLIKMPNLTFSSQKTLLDVFKGTVSRDGLAFEVMDGQF